MAQVPVLVGLGVLTDAAAIANDVVERECAQKPVAKVDVAGPAGPQQLASAYASDRHPATRTAPAPAHPAPLLAMDRGDVRRRSGGPFCLGYGGRPLARFSGVPVDPRSPALGGTERFRNRMLWMFPDGPSAFIGLQHVGPGTRTVCIRDHGRAAAPRPGWHDQHLYINAW